MFVNSPKPLHSEFQLKMAASLPDGDDAISYPEAPVCQQTYQNVAQSVLWLDIKLKLAEFITD